MLVSNYVSVKFGMRKTKSCTSDAEEVVMRLYMICFCT